MNSIPNREKTFALLREYNSNESLVRHALAVESVMIHFAKLLGEADLEKWGNIGLIHDLDYGMYPDDHCRKTLEILVENHWPAEYIHAVMSHGYGLCTEVLPEAPMEKVLYATDELTGLITATVLMRPDKSIHQLEVKSVMKKWKQKSFAAGVNREVIENGARMLSMEIDDLVRETIEGMKPVAKELGLDGIL
ncbi:MAG: hydrolase [Clostridia bacterium]